MKKKEVTSLIEYAKRHNITNYIIPKRLRTPEIEELLFPPYKVIKKSNMIIRIGKKIKSIYYSIINEIIRGKII